MLVHTFLGNLGATGGQERDSDGGYLQATYVVPSGTKIGAAYGFQILIKLLTRLTQHLLKKTNVGQLVHITH